MVRWIVFDEVTASQLRSRLPQEAVFEAPGRETLEYALESRNSVVTVLPLGNPNAAAVAVFRPKTTHAAPSRASSVVRATGFLGLGDELVLSEEETSVKKRWWRRLWEG